MQTVLTRIVTAAVFALLVANATAVLPAPWVFGHLANGRAFLKPSLELHVDPERPGTFHLTHPDEADGSGLGMWWAPAEPAFLSRYYNRLRTETAARHSRIRFRAYDTRTRQVYQSEDLHSMDHWRPNAQSRFRFVVNDPMELSPGDYMVEAFFYANPPYGPGFPARHSERLSPIGSVLPGRNILIKTMWAFPVTVVVEENAAATVDHDD